VRVGQMLDRSSVMLGVLADFQSWPYEPARAAVAAVSPQQSPFGLWSPLFDVVDGLERGNRVARALGAPERRPLRAGCTTMLRLPSAHRSVGSAKRAGLARRTRAGRPSASPPMSSASDRSPSSVGCGGNVALGGAQMRSAIAAFACMAAVRKLTGEAENNYRQPASDVPGSGSNA
jgi:hypothetical protein